MSWKILQFVFIIDYFQVGVHFEICNSEILGISYLWYNVSSIQHLAKFCMSL